MTEHIFGYTGRMFDTATGLQNNLNRWYDPAVGRWISEDPIGFAAGDANIYRYVRNGVINRIDPNGLQEIEMEDITEGIESLTDQLVALAEKATGIEGLRVDFDDIEIDHDRTLDILDPTDSVFDLDNPLPFVDLTPTPDEEDGFLDIVKDIIDAITKGVPLCDFARVKIESDGIEIKVSFGHLPTDTSDDGVLGKQEDLIEDIGKGHESVVDFLENDLGSDVQDVIDDVNFLERTIDFIKDFDLGIDPSDDKWP